MAYTVAQAEVTVTPDARNFGKDLRAQVERDADKVGRDIGDRMSASMTERLRDVKLDGIDTSGAERSVDRFHQSTVTKSKAAGRKSGEAMSAGMEEGFLSSSPLMVAAIGGALIAGGPVLAAAGGLLFGGLAAVAQHNNRNLTEAAGQVGTAWQDMVTRTSVVALPEMISALGLVRQAAWDMAPQFQQAFSSLTPAIDGVTHGVIDLVQNALPGVTSALQNSEPLFQGFRDLLGDVGTVIGTLFSSVANTDAGTVLSSLGDSLLAIGDALGTLMGAGTSVGADLLPSIAAGLQAIADVVSFLGPILPSVVEAFLGFKAAALLGSLFTSLAAGLERIGATAMVAVAELTASEAAGMAAGTGFGVAAAGARGLEAAMGPIGIAMLAIGAVLPFLMDGMGSQVKVQQEVTDGANAMTSALQQSKGAIDDQVRATAAQTAQSAGILTAAQSWGVAGATIVDALTGNQQALHTAQDAAQSYIQTLFDQGAAQGKSRFEVVLANKETFQAAQALGVVADASTGAIEAQIQVGTALQNAGDAAAANATRLQTLSNQAGAASGQITTLKNALDALTGKQITMTDAEIAVDAAVRAAQQAMDAQKDSAGNLTSSLTDANGQLDAHTAAGAAAYGALTSLRDSSNQLIATMEQQGATTDVVTAKDAELRGTFIQTAQQMGFSSDEANRLADQILGIPDARHTEITADTAAASAAAAAFQAQLDKIHNISITISAHIAAGSATAADVQNAAANIQHLGGAVGGIVHQYAQGGLEPMKGGVAQVVGPNTWRVIGDRATDDEAYIPINDSARSLAILAQTANRMGWGLSPAGVPAAGSKSDARSYQFNISAPSDPQAIAREIREAQRDLEFLHG